MRILQHGWRRVGVGDLWSRRTPAGLELCAGRGGDGAIVRLLEGEPIRGRLLEDLAELLELVDVPTVAQPSLEERPE